MNRIRPWLAIGKYRDTLDTALLANSHISAMLQLAARVDQPDITSLYLPVEDGESLSAEHLATGIAFVRAAQSQGKNVLIACGAGISRSALFAIVVVKEVEGMTLLDAACSVKRMHPSAMPHMALWDSLCDYYNEDISYLELLRQFQRIEQP